MSGRIRLLSQHAECSPWYILNGKAERLALAFGGIQAFKLENAIVTTGDCAEPVCPERNYRPIFLQIRHLVKICFYSELNFIIEAWHHAFTSNDREAIVSNFQGKSTEVYQDLMRSCFEEYYRVLKPGRWMTVVFSNSSNAVWRAIQEGLGRAGFVVADVQNT